MPDPQRDFILETDGSRIALGAVLKQRFDDTELEHPVEFFSKSLTGSKRNYVAYEFEMFAVVRAVEHFRMFLLGEEFLLRTDHSALRNLLRRDLPPTTRVERWILRLSEYSFRKEYQRGQDNVIADVLSRLPFATAEECGATSASVAQLHLDSQTFATTCCEPEWPNLGLVNLERNDNFESQSDTDESDTDSDTDLNYCTDFRRTSEQWCETETEKCNFISTSVPLVDIPISREGLVPEDFSIPTREEFAKEQEADTELLQLQHWVESKQCPSIDELAAFSGRMKAYAQLFDQISIQDGVLVIRRHDDPTRELTIVPGARGEHIIRFYHEGPGGSHQAPKATSAKIISCFWWPNLKRDVRLYVACCPVCERFIRLNRTPRAGLRSMEVGGRGDCVALDIVGGMDSLPLTPRSNRYILTLIDCFTSFAVAVSLVDQSAEVVVASIIGHYITVYGTPRRI